MSTTVSQKLHDAMVKDLKEKIARYQGLIEERDETISDLQMDCRRLKEEADAGQKEFERDVYEDRVFEMYKFFLAQKGMAAGAAATLAEEAVRIFDAWRANR